MIEQVWGGGLDVPGGCAAFCISFSRATVLLCRFFFNSTMPFWVDFTTICIFLAVYVYFIKKSNSVWAQNFRDVQLIPNFLRYPACL